MCPTNSLIECEQCKGEITSGQTVTCSVCHNYFHPEHCSIKTFASWRRLGKRRMKWRCEKCKRTPAIIPESIIPCVDCKSQETIIKIIKEELDMALEQIRKLKLELYNRTSKDTEDMSNQTPPSYANITKLKPDRLHTDTPLTTRHNSHSHRNRKQSTPKTIHPITPSLPEKTNRQPATPPKTSQQTKKTYNRKEKVVVAADSHGRDYGRRMQEELGDNYEILVVCHPGAPFDVVASSGAAHATAVNADHLIVMAGTNDLVSPDHTPALDISPLQRLPVSTNLYISHVPYRYDDYRYNKSIALINKNLDYLSQNKSCQTVNLNEIESRHHTRHGLHLNNRGKDKVCRIFARCVKTSHPLLKPSPAPQPTPAGPSKPSSSPHQIRQSFLGKNY